MVLEIEAVLVAPLPSRVGQDGPVPPDVRPIHALVASTRVWLQLSEWVSGLAFAAGIFFVLSIAAVGLDIILPTSPGGWPARLACLLLVGIPSAFFLGKATIKPLVRPRHLLLVARKIEKRIPGIHNRLTSALDLSGRESSALYHRLVDEVKERVSPFHPIVVLDYRRLRRGVLSLSCGLALCGLGWWLLGSRFDNAVARIVSPFLDIPPASGTLYTVQPGNAKVLRGDEILFVAKVARGQPASLVLEIENPNSSQRLAFPLQPSADDATRWTAALETGFIAAGFEDGFQYRIVGGGTWSALKSIAILDRPVLAMVRVSLKLPDYMGLSGAVEWADESAIAGAVGSLIEVTARAQNASQVASAALVLCERTEGNEQSSEGPRFAMRRIGDNWFGTIPVDRDGSFRVEMRNELGFANLPMKPRPIVARADNPPQIALKRPGPDLVRSEPGLVLLEIEAKDDYALDQINLVSMREGEQVAHRQVIKKYPPFRAIEKETQHLDFIQHDWDLAALGLKVGDGIRYYLEIRDRKAQVARTPDYTIRVQSGQNSVENLLDAFDKGQQLFLLKLDQLVQAHAEVRDRIEELARTTETPFRFQKLARLSRQEHFNTKAAELLQPDLAWSAVQLSQLPNVPIQLAEQMQAAGSRFETSVIPGMKNLADDLSNAAEKHSSAVSLTVLQKQSDRIQKDLEAVRDLIACINSARKKGAAGREAALADLMKEGHKLQAIKAARDLEDLSKHLATLSDELRTLAVRQQDLDRIAANTAAKDLHTVENKQSELNKAIEMKLAETRDLRDADEGNLGGGKTGEEAQEMARDLGGNDDLKDRQQHQREALDRASQDVASDMKTIDQLRKSLGNPNPPSELAKMLQSSAMKQAMAKVRRVRDAREQSKSRNPGPASKASGTSNGNLHGASASADKEATLTRLEPGARSLLLRMPPRLREDLMQSLAEKGPDGYQKFIESYFRKLTDDASGTRGGR